MAKKGKEIYGFAWLKGCITDPDHEGPVAQLVCLSDRLIRERCRRIIQNGPIQWNYFSKWIRGMMVE